MKILVIGGGGREHAIIWKLKENQEITKIFCAPGNAGIAELAECIAIEPTDIEALAAFAKNTVDFTVIGSEAPLALGIVDIFNGLNLPVFGPTKKAAMIEHSKAYSKTLMKKYGIPTAAYEIFSDYEKAIEYIQTAKHPLVIKADGLAAGKGVIISESIKDSEMTIYDMMRGGKFGISGETIVFEEFLIGTEVSVLAFSDGKTLSPMPSAQDHKRVYDNDKGLNTGGMGAFSPSPIYTDEIACRCNREIFIPTLNALNTEDRPYKGVIYFGLILTDNGPKVIEYNSRFGDPETQAILPRLDTDLFTIFNACATGTLDQIEIKWKEQPAACVILASGGYPGEFTKGYEITGLNTTANLIFHSGTGLKDGKIVTAGGRVLGITGLGDSLFDAIKNAYTDASRIQFKDMHYRKDIGR